MVVKNRKQDKSGLHKDEWSRLLKWTIYKNQGKYADKSPQARDIRYIKCEEFRDGLLNGNINGEDGFESSMSE